MKQIIWVMMILVLVGLGVAAEVCVVVEFPDKIESECLDVDEGSSGYELLEKSGFSAFWNEYPGWGYMLCKIGGVGTEAAVGGGCEYDGEYWAFYTADNGELEYSMVGLSSYEVNDGDLLVLSYGDGTTIPVMLKIDNLKAYVDGHKDKNVDETGGTIKDVRPGSIVKLKFDIKNLFDKDTDVEMENVELRVVLRDIDNGGDIELEVEELSISADKEEEIEIEFEIPLQLKEKNYELSIELNGEDDFGVNYEQNLEFEVELDKQTHELLLFSDIDSMVECGDTAKLDVELVNIGKKDEDVSLLLYSDELGFSVFENIELDSNYKNEDNMFEKSYYVEALVGGIFPITVKADYGSDTEQEVVYLNVSCESAVVEGIDLLVQQHLDMANIAANVIVQPVSGNAEITESEEIEFENMTPFLIVFSLVLLLLLVVVLIIFGFIKKMEL
ncbi:hypothetical protein ISS04_02310 [Candidatus Woesearchaeota archaeon]|nr:hypothetical protein [Candidatus Woesearchaeota archaeon]